MKTMIDVVPVEKQVETGEIYVSDLVDCDVAFGNLLAGVVGSLRESSTHPKHDSFSKFTDKPNKRKVIISNESDPKAFLSKLRAKLVGAEVVRENKAALPVVYFHRVQGLSFGLASDHRVIKDFGVILDDQNEVVAAIDEIPVSVTYQVYVLAWDQISLNKIAAGIFSGMATKTRTHEFSTSLLSVAVENTLSTSPAQDFMASDISLPSSEDRLLAYDIGIEVNTKVYQARVMNTSVVQFEISEGQPMFSEAAV